MKFESTEVPLRQTIIQLPWLFPVRVVPRIRHTHLLNTTHKRRAIRQNLGTFIEGNARTDYKVLSYSLCFYASKGHTVGSLRLILPVSAQ